MRSDGYNEEVLYAGNTITGTLFWFDNDEGNWNKSIYTLGAILNDPDFVEVSAFENGSISIRDALETHISPVSLPFNFPKQFGDLQLNIDSILPDDENETN